MEQYDEVAEIFGLISAFVKTIADDKDFWKNLHKIIKNTGKVFVSAGLSQEHLLQFVSAFARELANRKP